MDWSKEKVVVTGGCGMIGSHLVEALLARGVKTLYVVDNLSRGRMENLASCHEQVEYLVTDLRPTGNFQIIAPVMSAGTVFHLAARVTNIAGHHKDHFGMLQDNLLINNTVMEAVRRQFPRRLVAVSTVCVYPHDAPVPTMEQHAWPIHPEPTNQGYGLAKLILEQQAQYLHQEWGLPVVVPRFANAIGPRDYYDWDTSHVVPALIRKVHEHQPVVVWGSGQQTRTFMDARDLAETLVRLAELPDEKMDGQPVNVGWGEPIAISDLVWMILDLAGLDGKRVVFDTTRPDGHERREFCNARLVDLIGPPPCRPLADTLRDMIAEYQAEEARL